MVFPTRADRKSATEVVIALWLGLIVYVCVCRWTQLFCSKVCPPLSFSTPLLSAFMPCICLPNKTNVLFAWAPGSHFLPPWLISMATTERRENFHVGGREKKKRLKRETWVCLECWNYNKPEVWRGELRRIAAVRECVADDYWPTELQLCMGKKCCFKCFCSTDFQLSHTSRYLCKFVSWGGHTLTGLASHRHMPHHACRHAYRFNVT